VVAGPEQIKGSRGNATDRSVKVPNLWESGAVDVEKTANGSYCFYLGLDL